MKALAMFGILAGLAVLSTGCAAAKLGRNEIGYTPAYSAAERGDMIARNWDYEGKQMQDDIDSVLLLRPASHLTAWNVR